MIYIRPGKEAGSQESKDVGNWCNSCAFFWDLKTSDCAAWVQAWGSVIAICVAAWIASAQHREQRRRDENQQKEADRRTLAVAHAVAKDALAVVKRIGTFRSNPKNFENGLKRAAFRRELDVALETCIKLYLMQLPTASAINALVEVKTQLQRAHSLVDPWGAAFGDQSVGGSREYGAKWLPIYGALCDQATLIAWELRRIDNPAEPHPAGWDQQEWPDSPGDEVGTAH